MIFTTLFFGLKEGIIAVFVSLISIMVVAYLYLQNILFLSIPLSKILTNPISWITAMAVLTLLGTIIVLSYGIIQKKLMLNVRYSEKQAKTLSKMNTRLKLDIKKRRQAETELIKSEEKFRILYEQSNDAIFLHDLKGEIRDVNNRTLEMLGYQKEEIVSKYIFSLIPKSELPTVQIAFQETKEKGNMRIETKFIRKDGTEIFVDVISKIVDKKRGIVQGIARDITDRKQYQQRLQEAMNATIETMSKIVDTRDPYTAGHQYRVSQLAIRIARELHLKPIQIEGIKIASLIHDIGKIGIPSEILTKPSKLSEIEFSLIKGHSQIGYDILKNIDFPYPIAQIVLQHHERINGSGYPNGLKSDDILLEAKIIGLADVVEAMSSHRPYREALGIDAALEEIIKNKGILYAPEVVDVCIRLFREKGFEFE